MLVSARKKPGLTDLAYSEYWWGNHGALVRAHGHKIGFRRYIQTHLVPDAPGGVLSDIESSEISKNGQAELWWDSIASMLDAGATPEGQEASELFEIDEKRFCDPVNLSAFLADETVLAENAPTSRYVPQPGEMKVVIELWRPVGAPTFADWLGSHRAFVDTNGAAMEVFRYILNQPIDDDRFDFAKARGWKPAPDASLEMWFPDLPALERGLSGPVANAWMEDIAKFAQVERLCPLIGEPRLVFDHSIEAAD